MNEVNPNPPIVPPSPFLAGQKALVLFDQLICPNKAIAQPGKGEALGGVCGGLFGGDKRGDEGLRGGNRGVYMMTQQVLENPLHSKISKEKTERIRVEEADQFKRPLGT